MTTDPRGSGLRPRAHPAEGFGPKPAAPGVVPSTGSTIVDATAGADGVLRIVRHGVLADADIIRVVGADALA